MEWPTLEHWVVSAIIVLGIIALLWIQILWMDFCERWFKDSLKDVLACLPMAFIFFIFLAFMLAAPTGVEP
jgi:hypothetical protein